MYGVRINARRPLHPYAFGFRPTMTSPALILVTSSDSNITLANAEEFVYWTSISDHSPAYDETIDYCVIAQNEIDRYRARNNYHRQSTPFALSEHARL